METIFEIRNKLGAALNYTVYIASVKLFPTYPMFFLIFDPKLSMKYNIRQ